MSPRVVLAVVGAIAAALFLNGLGRPPFIDPSEGFHASLAREMLRLGDWVTLHVDGVRYFDKPPLLYWLIATTFSLTGSVGEWSARLPSAVPAIGVALVTAWLGTRLGSPRTGLIAGLAVACNLELFVFARLVKPDMLFVLCLAVALAGLAHAAQSGRRAGLVVFYVALGASAIAKDVLGAVAPLAALVLLTLLARERTGRWHWLPWWGPVLIAAVAAPWYLLVEARNPGFLWYTLVDNHLLNVARARVFPDEDVPLGALEFLGVTAVGFFPWSLALPWAIARGLRQPRETPTDRVWALLLIWTIMVIGFFTLAPFKLPHYGLPAFPAMALLVARLWDDVLDGARPARRAWVIAPALLAIGLAGLAALAVWAGVAEIPVQHVSSAEVSARTLEAQGARAPFADAQALRATLGAIGLVMTAGAVLGAVGWWAGRPAVALGAVVASMLGFLPATVEGLTLFAASRSVRPMAEAVAARTRPDDLLAHEGALENSGAWLLRADRPVHVVNGLVSNLAFGATFPEAAPIFWDTAALQRAWRGDRRVFLVTGTPAARSAVRELPADQVHLLLESRGRRLYSNRAGP
jgi:4-amino-4-deoxy-L-arabinose transferase-like glycosyltransferase